MRSLLAVVAVWAAVLSSACASSAPSGPWSEDRAWLIVDNRNTTRAATIFLMERSGVRQRLGRVRAEEVGEFRVDPRSVDYRLVADFGGSSLTSREFTLSRGDRWEWLVERNRLIYGRESPLTR
jgi:hypothetical protein